MTRYRVIDSSLVTGDRQGVWNSHAMRRTARGLHASARRRGHCDELIEGLTEAQVVQACSDLLRCLDRPATLRRNVLVTAGPLRAAAPAALHDRLHTIVTCAIDSLSRRQAVIVRRCDMHCEALPLVASDLGISTRQLYRDRAEGLSEIAAQLLRSEPTTAVVSSARTPSAIDSLVRTAEALVQCGNWRAAADMLENALAVSPQADQQTRIRFSLSELYLEAGRITLAERHIELQAGRPPRSPCEQLNTQILQARLTYSSADARTAAVPLRKSIRAFRQLARETLTQETIEGFVRSLMAQCDLDLKLGRIGEAVAASAEAMDVLSLLDEPNPLLSLAARTTSALCRQFSWEDAEAAQLELRRCYDIAIERGYLRESVFIATYMSGYYRISNQFEKSLQVVDRAMPTARALGPSEALGGLLTEMGWTLILDGRYRDALIALREARSRSCSNRELEAVTELLSARAWAGLGRPDVALTAAEAAETTLTQMGRSRLAAVSLIVQAEALQRLNHLEAAHRMASTAFDVLQSGLGKNAPVVLRAGNLLNRLGTQLRKHGR